MRSRPSSGMACLVESLGLRDVDDVLAIERAAFATPWTRAMFEAELLRNPFCRLRGARRERGGARDAELIGYVCYWVVFDEVRLMNVAVRPEHRRRRVASRLVRHALRDGRDHGAARAFLEVREGNAGACALYRAMGFAEYGRRRSYYANPQEDAILMRLKDPDAETVSGES